MTVTVTSSLQDLEQILTLQRSNRKSILSTDEMKEQGFVTVEHTLDLLQKMHDASPSIIIKDNDRVVAYALTMLRECSTMVPVLEPMFANFEKFTWNGRPLNEFRYYVMGQICIDKAYRGRGLFDLLYQKHKEVYSEKFDLMVTEIATRNTRSMRAHERVGFKQVNVYRDETDEWSVVIWDWKS